MGGLVEIAAVLVGVPFVALSGVWLFHERTKQSGWIDVVWTGAVGVAGALAALAGHDDAPSDRAWLYAAMAAAWSLRLGAHLTARTLRVPDDPRYVKMRQVWGAQAPVRMYGVLMFQSAAASLVAMAFAGAAHASDGPLGPIDFAALTLFAGAFLGETVSDLQMRRFRADPANHGGICDRGLWSWSRHPNYFFEWLSWCAVALGAFADPGLALLAALPAPLVMLHLLLNVSGVPPLERYLKATRGEAFEAYRRRVSRFFPRPPRPA